MVERMPEKISSSPTIRSNAEADLELRGLSRTVETTKKTDILERTASRLSDIAPESLGLDKHSGTIEDILKNPKAKEATDMFFDEAKLGKFNTKFETLKKTSQNPILKKFMGNGGGGGMVDRIDTFAHTYTHKNEKGVVKMRSMGDVAKKAYHSGNGFFSGLWSALKSVVGYQVARSNKNELLLWTPTRSLAHDIGKHKDQIMDLAEKNVKTATAVASEVREHKADKLALDHVKNAQKGQLDDLFKKGNTVHSGDMLKQTQKIYGDALEKGMKADPEGFQKQLSKGKGVNGMRMVKGVGGLMVAQVTVDALITGLEADDFGQFKEDFFDWDNIKTWMPGYGVWTGGEKLIAALQSKEPATTEEIVDIIIEMGFGLADIGFIFATMGGGLALRGGTKIAQSEIRDQLTKRVLKDGITEKTKDGVKKQTIKVTKEGLQKAEQKAAKEITEKSAGNAAKTGVKAARGEVIRMSVPSIKDAFLKLTPSGRIFNKFLLNKEQKRLIRNFKN